MRSPIFVRSLSEKERERLQGGLRSKDAFTLRRCQILLASSSGEEVPKIASNLGCAQQTVRNAIHDFGQSGLDALTPQKDPRLLRPEERPSLARDAPPLAEGVRIRHEPVDSGDVRGDRLRGGAHPKAGLGGDHT